jgi:glycosyltransferase involved in cell wall biosynthesis
MSERKFTVIITCGHGAELLRAALIALSVQEAHQFPEIIVADNGTVPGRSRVASDFKGYGFDVYHLLLPDASPTALRNTAIREASGDIFAFLDDDCTPPRNWLAALDDTFSDNTVGIVGGPDRVPDDAPTFERCLEYVLTSFVGTLGMRSGGNRITGYYPRHWNMAVRKEAIVAAGGFDEESPEAPELPMTCKIESMGYRTVYRADALVHHLRETNLIRFVSRDFRLSMERGRGSAQSGLHKICGIAAPAALILAAASAKSSRTAPLKAYAALLAATGVHAAARHRSPALALLVPPLMFAHHTAHIAGYAAGRLFRRRSAKLESDSIAPWKQIEPHPGGS